MTAMSQGNKKITTRKLPATNNKVLVRTGICALQEITATNYKTLVGTGTGTRDSSFLLLQQLVKLMAAIPMVWKIFILSGVSFVENTFTKDKTELSYTYFFGALPWMFEAAACSIFFLSF